MPGGDRLLKNERETVAIGEHVSTDVAMILAAAQSGDLEHLAEALAAWRGDLFEDLFGIDPSFDSWVSAERLHVAEHLVTACAEAARGGMARGEHDSARKIVNLLQRRDSTNEGVLQLALRLDALAGDSAGLHRRYERFRALLRSELDAAPSGETQRLFRELAARAEPAAPLVGIREAPSSTAAEEKLLRRLPSDLIGSGEHEHSALRAPSTNRTITFVALALMVAAFAALV